MLSSLFFSVQEVLDIVKKVSKKKIISCVEPGANVYNDIHDLFSFFSINNNPSDTGTFLFSGIRPFVSLYTFAPD